MYHLPYYKGKRAVNTIGPGHNYDGVQKAYETKILRASSAFHFSKSKRENFAIKKAAEKKFVPGVGSYPGATQYNTIAAIVAKKKPIISKYSFTRFTEAAGKNKVWVPGPGTYDLLSKPKKGINKK